MEQNPLQEPQAPFNSDVPPAAYQQISAEVRQFYQKDFKSILATFFIDPVNGLMEMFRQPPAKATLHAGILIGSVFVIYFAGSFLSVGDMRDYMSFADFLAIGTLPVLVILAIAGISYLIKLIAGGAQFKSELLTGALCGIPLAIIVVLAVLFRIFGEDINIISLFQSPFIGGNLMVVFSVYVLVTMFNVFQQSLRAAGIRDSYAWYLAPISILLALFIAFSITQNLF